jgi:hypothetical protein
VTERIRNLKTDYSEDVVDLTLIRWMLPLTPAERLQLLQRQVNAMLGDQKIGCRTVIFCAAGALHEGGVEFVIVGGWRLF